jgi:hypothetical protein
MMQIENLIHDVIGPIYLRTHRQAYCWLDEWFDLSFEDIRKMDVAIARSLKENFDKNGAKSGASKPNTSSSPPAVKNDNGGDDDVSEVEEEETEPKPVAKPAASRLSRLTGRLRARM